MLIDGRADAPRLGGLTLMPQGDALLPWRHAARQRRPGRAPRRARAARRPTAPPGARSRASAWPASRTTTPTPCRAACASGGALARTLLAGSRAWLLDEPFGALDALTRADLRRVLARTWEAEARPTTLLVTHDLDEALLLADRVLVSGPRPARIVAEVAVDVPRPREEGDAPRPELAELRRHLMESLRAAGAVA